MVNKNSSGLLFSRLVLISTLFFFVNSYLFYLLLLLKNNTVQYRSPCDG